MSAEFPWTALVGLAGIAGSVLTAHLANRAAERRLRLQQQQTDRTRFHDMRVEMYGKLFSAVESCRQAVVMMRPFLDDPTDASKEKVADVLGPWTAALVQVDTAAKLAGLVASADTRQAANALRDAAVLVQDSKWQNLGGLNWYIKQLHNAEIAFSEAARAELLPT